MIKKKKETLIGKRKNIAFIVLTVIALLSISLLRWKNQQEAIKVRESMEDNIIENIHEEIDVTVEEYGAYKMTNKEDHYSFVLPENWQKITKINFSSAFQIGDYVFSSVYLEGEARVQQITVNKIVSDSLNIDIIGLSQMVIEDFSFASIPDIYTVGDIEVVVVSAGDNEEKELRIFLFKQGPNAYSITYTNKDDIEKIILNGEW